MTAFDDKVEFISSLAPMRPLKAETVRLLGISRPPAALSYQAALGLVKKRAFAVCVDGNIGRELLKCTVIAWCTMLANSRLEKPLLMPQFCTFLRSMKQCKVHQPGMFILEPLVMRELSSKMPVTFCVHASTEILSTEILSACPH